VLSAVRRAAVWVVSRVFSILLVACSQESCGGSADARGPADDALESPVRSIRVDGGAVCFTEKPCGLTTTITFGDPVATLSHGLTVDPPSTVMLTQDELHEVLAASESLDFRKLIRANKRQCGEALGTSVTITFVTEKWQGRDISAAGCILDARGGGTSHPYRALFDAVEKVRIKHFGPTIDPGVLAACIFKVDAGESCETLTKGECDAKGGTWETQRKCKDGVPFP
jgi:hypothetical protein